MFPFDDVIMLFIGEHRQHCRIRSINRSTICMYVEVYQSTASDTCDKFYYHGLDLITARISNHMLS